MNTALIAAPQNPALSLLMDVQKFEHMQRIGRMFALSPLFPEHLRKGGLDPATANAVLVLNMANRLNEDPLTVAQQIYFVGGKPGWSTSYMIGKANQHGVFRDPIDWEVTGKGESLSVTAFGILKATGTRVQITCDMAMAKAEGWTKNPKYQSMPEQMLRYRSAAFLIRLYCPEVMIGVPMQVENELETMRDVSPNDAPVVEANKEPPVEAKAEEAVEADPPRRSRHEIQKEFARQQRTASEKPAPAEAVRQKEPEGPTEAQMQGLLDLMLAELAQAGPDVVRSTYSEQIDLMRRAFPNLHAKLATALDGPQPQDSMAQGGLFQGERSNEPDFLSTPIARQFLADVDAVGLQEAVSLHEPSLENLRRTSAEGYRALIRKAEDIEASA
ncbi:hypothetical protein SAMN05421774_10891 [Gemmobacter megaterium]|uniref:RecT family protein n=1 Tax=Gemmobacter megaterium TaxID=1086013 RepID=A0A1N7QBV7_9RHOB|nr:hypothetical protein [Gemmobacter megaterium]GGE24054.1 hypothetical protein GCM10011345_32540 [Gemmobacter megaterium]SIT20219.1 hypothetical protein SAMN05421774_10891 [Gemmobacter megaterium]